MHLPSGRSYTSVAGLPLVSPPAQHATRQGVRHRAVAQNDSTIHNHVKDSFAEVMRVFVGRDVANLCGIENDDVRFHPWAEHAAIRKVCSIRGLRRRFAHGLFEREEMLVANVVSEDARERAVGAGVDGLAGGA